MKKITWLVFIVCISCSNQSEIEIKQALEDFSSSIRKGEWTNLYEQMSQESRNNLEIKIKDSVSKMRNLFQNVPRLEPDDPQLKKLFLLSEKKDLDFFITFMRENHEISETIFQSFALLDVVQITMISQSKAIVYINTMSAKNYPLKILWEENSWKIDLVEHFK